MLTDNKVQGVRVLSMNDEVPIISWFESININTSYFDKVSALLDKPLATNVIAVTKSSVELSLGRGVDVVHSMRQHKPNLQSILQLDFKSSRRLYLKDGDVYESLIAPEAQATTLFRLMREGVEHETWLETYSRGSEVSLADLNLHTESLQPHLEEALQYTVRKSFIEHGVVYTSHATTFGDLEPEMAKAQFVNWGYQVTEMLTKWLSEYRVPKVVLSYRDNGNGLKVEAKSMESVKDFFNSFFVGDCSLRVKDDLLLVEEVTSYYREEKILCFLKGNSDLHRTVEKINAEGFRGSLSENFFSAGGKFLDILKHSKPRVES